MAQERVRDRRRDGQRGQRWPVLHRRGPTCLPRPLSLEPYQTATHKALKRSFRARKWAKLFRHHVCWSHGEAVLSSARDFLTTWLGAGPSKCHSDSRKAWQLRGRLRKCMLECASERRFQFYLAILAILGPRKGSPDPKAHAQACRSHES